MLSNTGAADWENATPSVRLYSYEGEVFKPTNELKIKNLFVLLIPNLVSLPLRSSMKNFGGVDNLSYNFLKLENDNMLIEL